MRRRTGRAPVHPVGDGAEDLARSQLLRGLRIATLLVAVVIALGLGGSNMVRHLGVYDRPAAQVGSFALVAAVLAADAVLLARRRPWGRLRGPAIAVVLAASVVSSVSLPDGYTSTTVDWMFGAANFVGLVVLLDRPVWVVGAFLSAHELIALLNLLLLHEVTRDALLRLATGSVNVIGVPLCVAVGAAAVRRIHAAAVTSRQEIERVRTEEAVSAEAHRRRQHRFAEISTTSVPLLEGLADGSLTPDDPRTQRRCAIEAARMRRLFAETDTVDNPLLHELRHCADVADRKGVVVELDSRGHWPTPPVAVRRELTDAALTALATAVSWARVTVMGDANLVSVNVVADCGGVSPPGPAAHGVRIEAFTNDETVWIEARWQPIR
ncbi:hypothetical protein ACU61A_01370 [Pseudonocardia sichuanensis]